MTNCEFGKLRRKRRQNCKYLVSALVMVRLEPGNSGGRLRGNYEMGNEDKLRLKFSVVIVFFKLNLLISPRLFLGHNIMSQWLTC